MAVVFLDQWDAVDHVWCARANRNLCDFIFKVVNPLFTRSRTKTVTSPTRNYHFGFSDRPETNSSSHVFSIFYPSFGQSSASGSFKNLSGLYKLERHHHMNTYCVTEGCVAWPMSAKFKRTYSPVAWPMSAKFKRTYSTVAWPMKERAMDVIVPPHPTPPMNTCTCPQPQRSMSFICKFTWTLIHAPPHPPQKAV